MFGVKELYRGHVCLVFQWSTYVLITGKRRRKHLLVTVLIKACELLSFKRSEIFRFVSDNVNCMSRKWSSIVSVTLIGHGNRIFTCYYCLGSLPIYWTVSNWELKIFFVWFPLCFYCEKILVGALCSVNVYTGMYSISGILKMFLNIVIWYFAILQMFLL